MNDQSDVKALDFWEDLYKARTTPTNGIPSTILARFVADRTPGTSLDLGCARGDDVVWLAKQGWQATGVDISPTALEYASGNALAEDVASKTEFHQHDLAESFPVGSFDLVSATFLQTPIMFPRISVLQKAASAVKIGGMLLITAHQRVAPWSWGDPDAKLPDGQQRRAELELDAASWSEIFVGSIDRTANGPTGETATVTDAVVALERRV